MPVEENGERYLSTQEAMDFLGVSATTFRELRREFSLQPFTIVGQGKNLFFRESELKKIPRIRPAQPEE